MKAVFSIAWVILITINTDMLICQNGRIAISRGLFLTKLSEHLYIHTFEHCNGIIVVDGKEAIIVSTPPSDSATLYLINWVIDSLKAGIKGYVVDRWHPDAMGGLDIVMQQGISSYTCKKTVKIAKKKDMPMPENTFRRHLKLHAGKKEVICSYLGPGHTSDGIVVWIPDEGALFGGNHVRNKNGWVGNIGDANIKRWSSTIIKIKKRYGKASVVIPGHGRHGDSGLLDYTIALYSKSEWHDVISDLNTNGKYVYTDLGNILLLAENELTKEHEKHYQNALIVIDQENRYVCVESPMIKHDPIKKQIYSENGTLLTFNKRRLRKPVEKMLFKSLTINQRDDEVKLTIIIRDMLRVL